jgi:MerR family redox-sensitive transcriptional activator SoxR
MAMPPAARGLAIGAVAERYGVAATTLRYWEQIGLLPPPPRSSGRRRYDLDALRRVKFIRMAKQSGLSLDAIRVLLAGHIDRSPAFADWANVARDQLQTIDVRIADLVRLRATIEECLECGCQHPRRCKLLTIRASTSAAGPPPNGHRPRSQTASAAR